MNQKLFKNFFSKKETQSNSRENFWKIKVNFL